MSDEKFKRVAALENPIEAGMLDTILTEVGIPHSIESFRDSAYNGLFQLQKGWGYVIAPESSAGEIKSILDDLRREAGRSEDLREDC